MKSSILPAIKDCFPALTSHSRWLVGDGTRINFWQDKWLAQPLFSLVNWQGNCGGFLSTVSSIISNGKWCIPEYLASSFPHIADMIQSICVPPSPAADWVIWELSKTGAPTFADFYNFARISRPLVVWSSYIWKSFIPPKNSFIL